MAETAIGQGARIIPVLRYRNAPAAIDWLCEVFGFTRHLVVPGPDGTIAHAQLTLGAAMIMTGSVTDNAFGRLMKQPEKIGGAETTTVYVVVPEIDAHYERARAKGAMIVQPIEDQDYGGRLYVCRDLESHLWSFGSYDPWAAP